MKTLNPDDDLVQRWKTLSQRPGSPVEHPDPGATILRPAAFRNFHLRKDVGALPRLDPTRSDSEFRVTQTLGQGGMGLVRLATQLSLHREVAIKTLIPQRHTPENSQDLLQESWITGLLEHPNIVPVHTLGVDETGSPMLVMKKIEGISWEDALDSPENIPLPLRAGKDLLETHLQILLQVANALQFAHSKGIIHCDLKPENVMLGDFGEVYLLDWGIAVSLFDDGTGRLPLASNISDVSGTPAYIAPELAAGEGEAIGQWTDTYLLGAILHQILTGEPRHQGPSVLAVLMKAFQSLPIDYGPEIPVELGNIANRATHPDGEQRFQNVEAFRLAITEFLRHRESQRLSADADHRRREHLQLAQSILNNTDAELDDTLRSRLHRLFAEAKFGFDQALAIWSQNPSAILGRKELLQTMFGFELQQRDPAAAALILDDLEEAPPEFRTKLDALKNELAREADQILRNERISRSVDLGLASRARSIMSIFLGLIFGSVPLINHYLISAGIAALDFQAYFTQFAIILPGSALVVFLMRKRLLANAINVRIITCIFVILFGALLMRIIGYLLGLDPAGCIALENALFAFALAMMTVTVDRRLWPAALAFLAGALGGALFPPQILIYDGISNAAALWLIAFAWRERRS